MIPTPMTALDAAEVARLQCDLLAFTARTFRERRGSPFIGNWHQRRIANALERVVLGRCPRLIINVPPRSGKTELAVVSFIAWGMGLYPDAEFIHASSSGRLAAMNTYNVRALMQTPTYLQVFPWTAIKADSSARDEFRTLQGGVVYAAAPRAASPATAPARCATALAAPSSSTIRTRPPRRARSFSGPRSSTGSRPRWRAERTVPRRRSS
jgi:hypothetical protein